MNRISILSCLLGSVLALGWGCAKSTPAPAAPAAPSDMVSYSFNTFFGNAGSVPMKEPLQLRTFNDTLWVVNLTGSNNFQAWTTAGGLSLTIPSYNSHALTPYSVGVGPDGYVYAGDQTLDQVVEFSPTGTYENVFGATQFGGGAPSGIALNSTDAYVCIYGGSGYHFSISGTGNSKTFTYLGPFGNTGAGTFTFGRGMALSGTNVWVGDFGNDRLVEFNSAGVYQQAITLLSSGQPTDVGVDGVGNLFALDQYNGQIQVFSASGAAVTQFGTGDFVEPEGLAFDLAYNLYVADIGANQVVVFKKN